MEEVERYSLCTQTECECFKSLDGTFSFIFLAKITSRMLTVQPDELLLAVRSGHDLNFDLTAANTIELKCFFPRTGRSDLSKMIRRFTQAGMNWYASVCVCVWVCWLKCVHMILRSGVCKVSHLKALLSYTGDTETLLWLYVSASWAAAALLSFFVSNPICRISAGGGTRIVMPVIRYNWHHSYNGRYTNIWDEYMSQCQTVNMMSTRKPNRAHAASSIIICVGN